MSSSRKNGKQLSAQTNRVRTAISSFIDNKIDLKELERLINKIEKESGANAAFKAYLDLCEFVLPKLQRVEHTGKDGNALSVQHMLSSLHTTPSQQAQALPVPDSSEVLDLSPEPEHKPQGEQRGK